MLKIFNVNVYDLKESLIASGNAMRILPVKYSDEEFEKGLIRCKKLTQIANNTKISAHSNYLVGIKVSFDIVYPQYWSPEFQRYHFADIVTSSSKMHCLLKMNLDKACNKYVSKEIIDIINKKIERYNEINSIENWDENKVMLFELRDGNIIKAYSKQYALYYTWMEILSNCPLGLELFMRVSTNYKQLQTIYFQRKNHKLKEDWGAFCKMIEELPYFKELILGE